MTTLEERLNELSPADRMEVEARTRELMSEELTRRELCHALEQTQVSVAKQNSLNIQTPSSHADREDLVLAALNEHISAMGGTLSLIVEFEGRAPVMFTGIGVSEDDYDDGVWGSFRFDTLSAHWRELAQGHTAENDRKSSPDVEVEDGIVFAPNMLSAGRHDFTQQVAVEKAPAASPDQSS